MAVEKKSDRWISITQSVLLHGLVIGALAYGVYAYKKKAPTPTPTLAIEGSVVESKDCDAARDSGGAADTASAHTGARATAGRSGAADALARKSASSRSARPPKR